MSILLLAACSFAAPAPVLPLPLRLRAAVPAVVRVERYYWDQRRLRTAVSAGVVCDPRGFVLTCAHCAPGDNVTVIFRDGREMRAEVRERDPAAEYALLELPKGTYQALRPHPAAPEWGDNLVVIGHPAGLRWVASRGVVSGEAGDWETEGGFTVRGLLLTDALITAGNSGGPLLDSRGRWVGVVHAINFKARYGLFSTGAAAGKWLEGKLPK